MKASKQTKKSLYTFSMPSITIVTGKQSQQSYENVHLSRRLQTREFFLKRAFRKACSYFVIAHVMYD